MTMMKTILCSAQWNGQLLMNKKLNSIQIWRYLVCECMLKYISISFLSYTCFVALLGLILKKMPEEDLLIRIHLVVNMTDIILTRCVSMLWTIRWNLRKMKCGCQSFIFQDHGDLLRDLFPIIDICWASNLLDQNILPPQISWSTLPKTIV